MDPVRFIIPILFVVSVLIAAPLFFRQLKRNRERMRRVAEELGFTYHGPGAEPPAAESLLSTEQRVQQALEPWRLTGMHDGVPVTIYPDARGGGSSRATYSIVEASFPRPLPFKVRIGRETTLARFGKSVFGLHDIEVGDEQFDAGVRIKGSDPDGIRRILSASGVQNRILAALGTSSTVTVNEQGVLWEKRGSGESADTYRQAMDLVVPIVRALKDARAFGED